METPENIRPWGRYDIIDSGEGYQVKRIEVKPGQRTSYQRHKHRSEQWTVVEGVATVILEGKEHELGVGEQFFVGVEEKHRIENRTEDPMVFIELQFGSYLGEDDIERFEDDYGRSNPEK